MTDNLEQRISLIDQDMHYLAAALDAAFPGTSPHQVVARFTADGIARRHISALVILTDNRGVGSVEHLLYATKGLMANGYETVPRSGAGAHHSVGSASSLSWHERLKGVANFSSS